MKKSPDSLAFLRMNASCTGWHSSRVNVLHRVSIDRFESCQDLDSLACEGKHSFLLSPLMPRPRAIPRFQFEGSVNTSRLHKIYAGS